MLPVSWRALLLLGPLERAANGLLRAQEVHVTVLTVKLTVDGRCTGFELLVLRNAPGRDPLAALAEASPAQVPPDHLRFGCRRGHGWVSPVCGAKCGLTMAPWWRDSGNGMDDLAPSCFHVIGYGGVDEEETTDRGKTESVLQKCECQESRAR